VEIRRADVKDLVFPGNLREIMNRVIETERQAEAHLIEARQQAEALRIRTQAENEAEMRRLEAEAARVRTKAEADRERLSVELANAVAEAKALAENPQLVRLRELETLRAMAEAGARFAVGLDGGTAVQLFD